jgi:hypothetical protein
MVIAMCKMNVIIDQAWCCQEEKPATSKPTHFNQEGRPGQQPHFVSLSKWFGAPKSKLDQTLQQDKNKIFCCESQNAYISMNNGEFAPQIKSKALQFSSKFCLLVCHVAAV